MKKHDWVFRRATIPDFDQMARFLRSGRRSSDRTYFLWKLMKNPFHEGFANIADLNGKVIGGNSICPKVIAIKGNFVRGAELCDVFTDSQHQRKGIFAALVNKSREETLQDGLTFIYGTPRKILLEGYATKCNFKLIPSIKLQMRIKPLRPCEILTTKGFPPLLAKAISFVASPVLNLLYPVREKSVKSISLERIDDEIPQAIDALADRCVSRYDWSIYRNREYLKWRYMDNPDRYEIWIAREADEIRGYIVGKVGIWKSLRVGYIADYIEDGEGEVFDLLLAKAMYHFQNENVHMIAAWTVGGSHYATVLKQSGFLKAWDIPVICYWNQVGVDVTSTVKRWHFTMADSDNI